MTDRSFQDDFERLVACAVERGGEPRWHYRGFSSDEVDEVERACGRPLPPAYRDFLLVMGHRTGRAFEYVTMCFEGPSALLEFQRYARQLIAEEDPTRDIPAGAFFCSNYLDSQLSYFDADLGEGDPRLFDFELGNPEPVSSKHTLASYVCHILSPSQ